jgi:hypothetical protein
MFVTVKGLGFDVKFKNEYFLDIRHDNTKLLNTDTIDYTGLRNTVLSDPNMLTITDTSITFKLSKYMLDHTGHDSAFAYFLKLKRGSDSKDVANNIINYRGYVKFRSSLPISPVYKLLRDTLVLNKTYQTKNKSMITGSNMPSSIKIMIHGLEYPSKDGYFLTNTDYSVPSYHRFTLSMIATQDLFTLPDGWHDFEIYESGGKQRKFVEETGKTKIYIKNEQ